LRIEGPGDQQGYCECVLMFDLEISANFEGLWSLQPLNSNNFQPAMNP
jgi:hypothetical protein